MDLTPLWGYVKDIMYCIQVRDLDEQKHRIITAITKIPEDMLGRIWQEVEYHLDVVRTTKGDHVEFF